MSETDAVDVQIPKPLLKFLTLDARTKVAFGGRGGGKTESFARMLVMRGARKKQRAFCTRQTMKSIEDSVHSTIKKSITALGADDLYTVTDTRIRNNFNNSDFIYGQMGTNLTSMKSKDEVDIGWIEEAEDVSARSLEVFEPSIRAKGSEVWISLNLKDTDGAVYKEYIEPYFDRLEKERFIYEPNVYDESGEMIEPGILIVWINLDENPLAPSELKASSAKMKREKYAKWKHIYGGYPQLESTDRNLIQADQVLDAQNSMTPKSEGAALVIGVDPARYGKDETAIIRRQGRQAYALARFKKQSTMETAGRVAMIIRIENPDMVFIDVGGLGAGVYDRLIELGFSEVVTAVNFGGKANKPERFFNKRSEMWVLMKEWLESVVPANIPDDSKLAKDLTVPQYEIQSDGKYKLESKKDMFTRLTREGRAAFSPDAGDALALTFADTIIKRDELMSNYQNSTGFRVGDAETGY